MKRLQAMMYFYIQDYWPRSLEDRILGCITASLLSELFGKSLYTNLEVPFGLQTGAKIQFNDLPILYKVSSRFYTGLFSFCYSSLESWY